MAYLYRHIRLDINKPFYIGIGSDDCYKRAHDKNGRSKAWYKVVNKAGYEVEILMDDISWDFAKIKEIEFIALYGRRDLNNGILVNMTDGGDGLIGLVRTDAHKEKVSKSLIGHSVSKSTREKLSNKLIGVPITYTRSKITIEKSRQAKLGSKNPMYGKKGSLAPFFRGMIEAYKDGVLIGEYEGIYDAGKQLNVCYKKVSAVVNGKRKTTGGYEFKRR